jgi:DNA-directed RNA polymerase subunit F
MITELIPTSQEYVKHIREKVPLPDLYEQLAEEAAELSQAANKMARYLRGVNPTPKTEKEVHNDLIEEYTDVVNVACNILDIHPDWLVSDYKLYRWSKRLDANDNSFECESCRIE